MSHVDSPHGDKTRNIITLLLAIVILGFSFWGFGTKFLEFIAVATGEVDGMFALTPIVNYLLASLGFLCLFGWAAANGMFHDIEKPKQTMLENEARLDASLAGAASKPTAATHANTHHQQEGKPQ